MSTLQEAEMADKSVSQASVTYNGNTSNIIGDRSDPNHGHVVVTPTGDVRYARGYGESRSNPSIPDSRTGDGSGGSGGSGK